MAAHDIKGAARRALLAASVTAADTAISGDNLTLWPTGIHGLIFDPDGASPEKVLVVSRAGNTLTTLLANRGADGTSAQAWAAGTVMEHVVLATWFQAVDDLLNLPNAKGDLYTATAADTPARLAAGANGLILTTDSAEATGLKWSASAGIPATLLDAKGDLIVASAADTAARLAAGANGKVLEADSAEATGLKWGDDPIRKSLVDAKGDLLVASAADTVARLGVGANGTVLTADSAEATGAKWAAPASAALGDLLDYQRIRKAADQSVTSSTVLVNDTHFVQAIGANQEWDFELDLFYDAGTTGDIKFAFTVPAGATVLWNAVGFDPSLATLIEAASGSGTVITLGGRGAGILAAVRLAGTVVNAGTAGNLQLQWAQNSSSATASTVKASSIGHFKRFV